VGCTQLAKPDLQKTRVIIHQQIQSEGSGQEMQPAVSFSCGIAVKVACAVVEGGGQTEGSVLPGLKEKPRLHHVNTALLCNPECCSLTFKKKY
jgi:hypothetical protein